MPHCKKWGLFGHPALFSYSVLFWTTKHQQPLGYLTYNWCALKLQVWQPRSSDSAKLKSSPGQKFPAPFQRCISVFHLPTETPTPSIYAVTSGNAQFLRYFSLGNDTARNHQGCAKTCHSFATTCPTNQHENAVSIVRSLSSKAAEALAKIVELVNTIQWRKQQ